MCPGERYERFRSLKDEEYEEVLLNKNTIYRN